MTKSRLWILGGVVGAILLFLVGYFLLIGPTRQAAADLRATAADLDTQNQQLAIRLQDLQNKAPEVPQQLDKIAGVRAKIPEDLDIGPLVSQLQSLASGAGVSLNSVSPGTPFYETALTPEQRAQGEAVEDLQAAADDGVPTTALVAAGQTVVIPLEIQGAGSYRQVRAFVNSLEETTRALLVKGITVSRDGDGNQLAYSLSAEVFSAPGATWDIRDVTVPGVSGAGTVVDEEPDGLTPPDEAEGEAP